MIRLRHRTLAFSMAFGGALTLAAEDLTVISRTSAGDDKSESRLSTHYMSSTKSRTTDGQNDTIIEFKTGRYVFVNHKKKEYWETTAEEMAAYMDKLEKDVKGNPIWEAILGEPGAVKVEKGGTSRKVAGYDCDDYSMSMGTNFVLEFCAAKGLQPPPQYFEGRRLSSAAMGPMGNRYVKMFEEMKKIEGFPLATETHIDMGAVKQTSFTEATEVKKGAIPDSVFAIPAGYAKKPSPLKE